MEIPNNSWPVPQFHMIGRRIAVKSGHAFTVKVNGFLIQSIFIILV